MWGPEIIRRVGALQLKDGTHAVFGSGPMAFFDIREAADIDVLVLPEVWEEFKQKGWTLESVQGGKPLQAVPVLRHEAHPAVDLFKDWPYEGFQRTPAEVIAGAFKQYGVRFATLEDVELWKAAFGRKKDLDDLELIAAFRRRLERRQRS